MQKPKELNIAVGLLIVGFVFFLLRNILPPFFAQAYWPQLHLYFLPVEGLVYLFLIWQIKLEQNWARIVTVILFIIGLIGLIILYSASGTVQTTLQGIFGSSPSKPLPNFLMMFATENHDAMSLMLFLDTIEKIFEAVAIFLLFGSKMHPVFSK